MHASSPGRGRAGPRCCTTRRASRTQTRATALSLGSYHTAIILTSPGGVRHGHALATFGRGPPPPPRSENTSSESLEPDLRALGRALNPDLCSNTTTEIWSGNEIFGM